jgi:hypothetical protein
LLDVLMSGASYVDSSVDSIILPPRTSRGVHPALIICRTVGNRSVAVSRSLRVAEAWEVAMADYATLLRGRVTLRCRSIDGIFLQGFNEC